MVAAAAVGLIVLRVLSSFHPAIVVIDDRRFSGFSGFLQFYDLWWALYLMLAVLALGLLQLFGP